jgi:pimeloyl-ACP methyl ester carboxylesterase
MLHETPRSAWSFAPLMRKMGTRFNCFAPDTLGFGMSDGPATGASMEDLARSMIHFLDQLGIERVQVLGFHTGNKIAAAMAAAYPQRIEKTVLIGMTHSLVVSRKDRNAAIMEVVRKHMGSYQENPDGSHLLRNWASDFSGLSQVWWNPVIMAARRITPEVLRGQEARMVEMVQCRKHIAQVYAMNFDFDFSATLRRIKAPSQVIECCVPQEAHLGAQGPKVLKLLKRGELVTLQNAGFDATEAFAGDISRHASRFFLTT